jgi:hypothetical protein
MSDVVFDDEPDEAEKTKAPASPTEPLCDEEAERAMLGCALVDDEHDNVINLVADILPPEDFYEPAHLDIWRAMLAIHHDGAEVDACTLSKELADRGLFSRCGGPAYLDQLIDARPVVPHPEEYARIIAEFAWRRRLRLEAKRFGVAVSERSTSREDIERSIRRLQRSAEDVADELPSMTSVELDAKTWESPSGWLVHDWMLASACFMIAGHPKSAKSIIAAALCLSVVSGEDFLRHWPVTKRGPAIFINGEDGEQMTQPRLRKLAATLGISYPQPDLILSCQQECDISTPRGWGRIARLVRRIKPVITVIDCFRRFAFNVNENNSSEVSPILCRARNLQKETGTAIGFVHHLSRDTEWNKKVPPIQRLRGSGDFYAWIDTGIGMEHPDRKKTEHYMTALHRGAGSPDEQCVHIAWDDERNECNIRLGEPRTKKERQQQLKEQREAFG